MLNIEEIKARVEAATHGPWRVEKMMPNVHIRHEGIGWPICAMFHTADGLWKEDAEFIAHARKDIPDLIVEIERLNDIITSIRNYETEAERQVARDGDQIKGLLVETTRLTIELAESRNREQVDMESVCAWERMENACGELEGFMCECGHQSNAATPYCSNCGRKMSGGGKK